MLLIEVAKICGVYLIGAVIIVVTSCVIVKQIEGIK